MQGDFLIFTIPKMLQTQRKRLIATVLVVGLYIVPTWGDTISQRMSRFELSGLQYYSYYLSFWWTTYNNYPFVVKASVSILLFCAFSIIFLTFSLLSDKYKDSKKERFYRKLKKKYYDSLSEIFTCQELISDEEIIERTGLTAKDKKAWKGWKMVYIGKLFVEIKSAFYEEHNYKNVNRIVLLFGLQEFVENTLTFGRKSYKVQALRLSQFLMMNIPESILVRLLDFGTHAVRKEVRMYYLWLSDYSPFRFFTDKNVNYEFRPWDALELHHLLNNRKRANKEIPSILPIVSICNDKQLKACLIREVAFWGTPDEVIKMSKYITSKETIYRKSALQCMGMAKCLKAEDAMEDAYPQQTEELKYETLKSLFNINSGKATPFFVNAFNTSSVKSTKFYILMYLWRYNEESKAAFYKLEELASPDEALLFNEVKAFSQYQNIAS